MQMDWLDPLRVWLLSTSLSSFMKNSTWAWPISESLHFVGLSLLIGTIGILDLRMLGLAKRLPLAAVHDLVPWGIAGYALNVMTGVCFFTGEPGEYIENVAFQLKMSFMLLAGINVLVFYSTVFRQVEALRPGEDAPLAAKIIVGASLFLWVAVMCCGRMLTFFRPALGGQP